MITVCILLKDGARTLAETLDSVRSFNEIIVLDNGSTDESKKIATSYPNVRWMESSFIGFGPLRNVASALASNDWILALDADEVISQELLKEINALHKDPKSVYSIPRDNYYNGKHIKGCGWYPDRVIRLYNRKETRYSDSQVHESVIAQKVEPLHSPILHTPFQTTADFLAKMQHYSTLFAKQYAGKKKSSPIKAFFHSLFAFFRSYFLRSGWRLGAEGFIISLYNSNTVYYKYLKLYEENYFNIIK
jgi:glycosyltransferase involved in cell wall biosynthesis